MNFRFKFEQLISTTKQCAGLFNVVKIYDDILSVNFADLIARLFVRVYGTFPTTNICEYQKDNTESELLMFRRKERIALNKTNSTILSLQDKGYKVPQNQAKRNEGERSIPKDVANMIMVDEMLMHHFFNTIKNSRGKETRKQKDTFLDIINKKDYSSHHITADDIVGALEEIDYFYEDSKNIKDKVTYIDRWVNFHRMETRIPVSLINYIADYMIENNIKDLPTDDELSSLFWCDIEFIAPTHKFLSEPISLLAYNNYVPLYFSKENTINLNPYFKNKRILEVIYIDKLMEIAKYTFAPYFTQRTDDAIDVIYEFCHNNYPIIESHKKFNFYENDPKLYSKKVKYIRKIMKRFFKVEKSESNNTN